MKQRSELHLEVKPQAKQSNDVVSKSLLTLCTVINPFNGNARTFNVH